MDDADITLGKLSSERLTREGDGVGVAIIGLSAEAVGVFFLEAFGFGLGCSSEVVFSFGGDAFVDGLGVVARLTDPVAGLHGDGGFPAIAEGASGPFVVLDGIDSHFMLGAGRWRWWRHSRRNNRGFWECGFGCGRCC